jgi:phage minor structural protein
MAIFCYDRTEKLVCVLENKIGACNYFDATMREVMNGEFTAQFSVDATNSDAQLIPEDGYFIIEDENGVNQLFVIVRFEDAHGTIAVREIFGEHAEVELIDEVLNDLVIPTQSIINDAINGVIQGTKWQLGTVVDMTPSPQLSDEPLEIIQVDRLTALRLVRERWGGDIPFRTAITGSTFNRYVDYDVSKGTDLGVWFEYSKDVEEITRETDTSLIKTALIGIGGATETQNNVQTIVFPKTGGVFDWQIIDLSNPFNTTFYTQANIFTTDFTNGQLTTPPNSIDNTMANATNPTNFTPLERVIGQTAGQSYPVYGGVKTPSGAWYRTGWVSFTLPVSGFARPVTSGVIKNVDFTHVVWQSPPNPANKPDNQSYVEDVAAKNRWGRTNSQGQRSNLWGFYKSETTDPALLLQETWDELQRLNKPLVRYTAKVVNLSLLTGQIPIAIRVGDEVKIIDRDMGIEVQTRVYEKITDLNYPERSELVFNQFRDLMTDQLAEQPDFDDFVRAGDPVHSSSLTGKISEPLGNSSDLRISAANTYIDAGDVWLGNSTTGETTISGNIFMPNITQIIAWKTGNQTLTIGAVNKITTWFEQTDVKGEFNPTNGVFQPLSKGMYLIDIGIKLGNFTTAGADFYISIYKNNVESQRMYETYHAQTLRIVDGTAAFVHSASHIVVVQNPPNDYFELAVHPDVACSVIGVNSYDTYFRVVKLA